MGTNQLFSYYNLPLKIRNYKHPDTKPTDIFKCLQTLSQHHQLMQYAGVFNIDFENQLSSHNIDIAQKDFFKFFYQRRQIDVSNPLLELKLSIPHCGIQHSGDLYLCDACGSEF